MQFFKARIVDAVRIDIPPSGFYITDPLVSNVRDLVFPSARTSFKR